MRDRDDQFRLCGPVPDPARAPDPETWERRAGGARTETRPAGLCACPHGEADGGLVLCAADLSAQGYSPSYRARDCGRFIVTPWWCAHKCRRGRS